MSGTKEAAAVLISGGVDSAVLLAEAARSRPVWPVYVRCGLYWEADEIRCLHRFLAAIAAPNLKPLQVLEFPAGDIYGSHWSITGCHVPDGLTADEAVYLPGRNLLLLSKALLWCHLHQVTLLMLGVLAANPFPDATESFFEACRGLVNQSVNGKIQIARPFATLNKVDVVRRGAGLPLALTFSCIQPCQGLHCGNCNKCAERSRAFKLAGIDDPTKYAGVVPCTG